jgi:hypothetical protein
MSRAARIVPLAVVVCIHLGLALLIFNHIEEDAFIYFRIAVQLADGHGFVFNRAGPTVEASSSLLWQGLLAGLAWLRLDLIVGAKLAGIVCGALLLWVAQRLARLLVADPWLATLPAFLTVLSPPFAAWTQLGLETPLHAGLVVAAAWFTSDPRLERIWWVPNAALLASRPEGFLYLVALLPFFVGKRGRWRELLPGVAVLVGVLFGLLLFRLLYFRDLVPHPFYIKIEHDLPVGASNLRTVFLGMHLYLLALPLLAVAWRRSFWSPGATMAASFLAVVLAWNYDLFDGKHFFRHLLPALPLFYVLCAAGFDRLLAASPWRRPALWTGCAGSILLLALQAQVPSRPHWTFANPIHAALGAFLASPGPYAAAVVRKLADPNATTLLDRERGIGHNWQVRVGEFLGRNYPPGTTFAYDQMGQTPWYAGPDRNFVDLLGLTDQRVGYYSFKIAIQDDPLFAAYDRLATRLTHAVHPRHRRPVSEADVLDYLFEEADPDVVLVNCNFWRALHYVGMPLVRDPRFAARYEPHYVLGGLIDVYGRPGEAPPEFERARGLTVRRVGPGRAPCSTP